ncbi:hypothetical protein [Bacillus sp. Marseille-P3661]|uniref:hypothetical protein n=1 Tax=Bacillus sp. Marseille-P3661 TaxID=1936234 RepID=UPI000C860B69|nr:hypothetical protein [Bacillus sp. Marseille-P3661]
MPILKKEVYDYQEECNNKKKLKVGKLVKQALKDYLKEYKGHGARPLFPRREGWQTDNKRTLS